MVMHAAKHAHGEVCGVLLGQAKGGSGGEADGAGASSDPVFVEDAVPLFHKSEGVTSPLLEAALAQVDSYAQARGRKVVGFYQANERNDDRELHFSTKRIADVIREKSTRQACILLMNNEGFTALLSSETRDLPFQLHVRKGGQWVLEASKQLLSEGSVADVVLASISAGRQQHLVDFSEHICDISKDWRNLDLVK